jgi:hypothetical protein
MGMTDMTEGDDHPTRFGLAVPAVFLLSASVLVFEVALTRIFSVMLSYHFVFAIVSSALLGLGAGGMLWKRWRQALPASGFRASAVLFALLIAVSVPAIVSLPVYRAAGPGAGVHRMWGVNGIASVLGSALSMIVGISIGFSFALYLGALLYAGVALQALLLSRLQSEERVPAR